MTQPNQDPKTAEAQPPFDEQQQPLPGHETQMNVKPDHGENTYRGSGKMTGRAAIITGSDSGIGRAVAIAFAREGADVLISYLSEDDDARETARLVEEAGQRAVTVAGDIGEEAHCQAIVERAMQEFGRLDVLVNNAAHQKPIEHIRDFPSDEWDRTYKTNIYSMFYLCKAAAAHMKPGACIVNTCSVEAKDPDAMLLAYASTKGAIVTFTKSLAKMLIKDGIRVNAVAPGPVWTPLIVAGMPEEQMKTFGKDSPMGRPAQPGELAPVYVLLASGEASYSNGEIYSVAGGSYPV